MSKKPTPADVRRLKRVAQRQAKENLEAERERQSALDQRDAAAWREFVKSQGGSSQSISDAPPPTAPEAKPETHAQSLFGNAGRRLIEAQKVLGRLADMRDRLGLTIPPSNSSSANAVAPQRSGALLLIEEKLHEISQVLQTSFEVLDVIEGSI